MRKSKIISTCKTCNREVKDEFKVSDVSGKEIDRSLSDVPIKLKQIYSDWGNDSIDGCGEVDLIDLEELSIINTLSYIGEACFNGIKEEDRTSTRYEINISQIQMLKLVKILQEHFKVKDENTEHSTEYVKLVRRREG